ncbi:hypothetical protein CJ030_MR8G027532 [Morella rubra]|uniref:Uncharacterized protein n=1 Tax=Morella rubra TaxID=262757 RepID=A0A6A1URW7_9ROSI|nr:hypothetical protein CJ030_MR8G027532 [Morella rubra]
MLQAIRQQFEHMTVMFNDIQDRIDRQDVVIATWCEGCNQEVEFEDEEDRGSLNGNGRDVPKRGRCGIGFQRDSR